jgi:hypothetical protein
MLGGVSKEEKNTWEPLHLMAAHVCGLFFKSEVHYHFLYSFIARS